MRRREFIAGSTAMFAAALSTRAAALDGPWRIGQVFGGSPNVISSTGLAQGLSDLGYVDGKNILLQSRFTAPNPTDMKAAILALVPDVDLLVVWGTIGGIAAKAAAPIIPVVLI
jgi:putative ABC transport system substrate-binding protein